MKRLQILLIAFLFASCIEYSETMWINEDGSGQLTVSASIDKNLLSLTGGLTKYMNTINTVVNNLDIVKDTVRNFVTSLEGIEYETIDLYTKGNSINIDASIRFNSSKDLNEAFYSLSRYGINISRDIKPFDISITPFNKNDLLFKRKVNSITNNSLESLKEDLYFKTFESLLSMYNASFTIHFPYPITESNANNNTDYDNTIASWDFSLSSLLDDIQIINARLSKEKEVIIAKVDEPKKEIGLIEKTKKIVERGWSMTSIIIIITVVMIVLFALFSIRFKR
ncbi:MAG: hypothetical protein CBD04_006740 [bacterium TMED144]|nr:MAG: hypothetical protein CBD04_006740 [bacterium TMED144]